MILAEVSFTTEGLVVISGLLGTVAGSTVFIFKLLMKAKDDQIAQAISREKSFKDMFDDLAELAEKRIVKEGSTVKKLADVKPEHQSPPTEDQKKTAEIATARARLTAIHLADELSSADAEKEEPVEPSTVKKLLEKVSEVKEKIAVVADAVGEVATEKIVNKVAEKVAEKVADKLQEK